MTSTISVLLIIFTINVVLSHDPDINRTGAQLITSKGFILEDHYSTTPDGYILHLLRFYNPNVSIPLNAQRPPVLLQHGLLDSSDTWVVNYRKSALGFILADAGYDVWLGNTRGNKYSRNHTQFNPNPPFNSKFWDFTYDEMAKYDLPTLIDTVRNVTKLDKIAYIGHSQGTTQVFSNLAQLQNSKFSVADSLSIFIALAPVTYIYHTGSALLKLLSTMHLDSLVQLLGDQEFLPDRKIFEILFPGICGSTPGICDAIIKVICGFDPDDVDNDRLPVFVAHFPSGTAVKELVHYAQGVRHKGWFKMYDYGLIGNENHYHQSKPPVYNLSSITAPTAIFYGGKDDLADKADVEQMLIDFPTDTVKYMYYNKDFGHTDFIWGKNTSYMNGRILDLLKKYSK